MPTWKLLIIWEVILCELNVNGRDLSGQAVKFPTAGKKCGWLLTGLSSCRNLHSRKLLLASVRHPEQNFLSHLSGSVKPLLSFQSLSRERSAFTRVPGILTPDYPQVRFFRGKSIVGYSEEIGESHILIDHILYVSFSEFSYIGHLPCKGFHLNKSNYYALKKKISYV